jgi:hypothetical protein
MRDSMSEWKSMEPMDPEGWLGDPEEWPVMFLLDKETSAYNLQIGLRGWREVLSMPQEERQAELETMRTNWRRRLQRDTVYVYCCIEDYEESYKGETWHAMKAELLSALPDVGRRQGKTTWLEHELCVNGEDDTWQTILGWDYQDDEWLAKRALEMGVCPGQWFILKLKPHYITYPATVNGPEEYDFEISAEFISAQWLPLEEHARRWAEYLKRRAM